MAASPTIQPSSDTLGRITGLFAGMLGALGLLLWATSTAFGVEFAPALRYSNVAAAVLDIGLAAALVRGSRGAWAYAVITGAVLLAVNAFAIPTLLKGGPTTAASAALMLGQVALFILLLLPRSQAATPAAAQPG